MLKFIKLNVLCSYNPVELKKVILNNIYMDFFFTSTVQGSHGCQEN